MEPPAAVSRIQSGQLVRLLDMLRFYAAPFTKSINQLQILLCEVQRWMQESRRRKDLPLREPELKRVVEVVYSVERECEKLGLARALETIALFRPQIRVVGGVTLQVLELRIQDIQKSVFMDLYDPAFVYIPEDRKEYVDRDWLFDDDEIQVSKAFPEAGTDIRASGHCYAVGCTQPAFFT